MVEECRPRCRRKTKSAPPRFSAREDVWKDIRDWAKPNTSGSSNAIGAQLKDNVTEQRMLESRLLDLSKERYKFNMQVSWQRKTFMDKQRSKAGQMKELLAGIEAAQIQSERQHQTSQLTARTQQYHDLKMKAYADRRKRGNSAKNSLTQMKPICVEPVFTTQRAFVSGPVSRSMFSGSSKQTTFPNVLALTRGYGNRSSSVPPRLPTRRTGKPENNVPSTQTMCSSAGSIPRYLQYRSVYDSRFSELESSLFDPVLSDASRKKSLRVLLGGLPGTHETVSNSSSR